MARAVQWYTILVDREIMLYAIGFLHTNVQINFPDEIQGEPLVKCPAKSVGRQCTYNSYQHRIAEEIFLHGSHIKSPFCRHW